MMLKGLLTVSTPLLMAGLVHAGNSNPVFWIDPATEGENVITNVSGPNSSVILRYTIRNNTRNPLYVAMQSTRGVTPLYSARGPVWPLALPLAAAGVSGSRATLRLRVFPRIFLGLPDVSLSNKALEKQLLKGSSLSAALTFCAADALGNMSPFLCATTAPGKGLFVAQSSSGEVSSAPTIVSGYYSDASSTLYPLMGVSYDLGTTWNTAPSGIAPTNTSPSATYPFQTGGNLLTSCSRGGSYCIASRNYTDTTGFNRFLLATNVDATNPSSTWSYLTNVSDATGLSDFGDSSAPLVGLQQGYVSGNAFVVPGYYVDNTGLGRLVVVAGLYDTANSNWSITYPSDITHPQYLDPAFAQGNGLLGAGMSASGNYLVVGTYTGQGSTAGYPFLGVSDGANTNSWSSPSSFTNPQNLDPAAGSIGFGQMESVSCSGSLTPTFCIAVGNYYAGANNTQTPVAAVSTDQDSATWSYPTTFTQPYGVETSGVYTAAYCDFSTCAAVGSTSSGALLGYTIGSNFGTWSFPSGIPSQFPAGSQFNAVTVVDDATIIAVGQAIVNSVQQFAIAVGTVSRGTVTWSYPSVTSQVTDFNGGATFSSVACTFNTSTCIASGSYQNTSNQTVPATFVSSDGGASWTFSETLATPDTNPTFSQGAYSSAAGGRS